MTRTLTDDGRRLVVAGGLAAGTTLVGMLVAGILIGMVAAAGAGGGFRLASAILLALGPALGSLVGARRAAGVTGPGLAAAVVGLAGALAVLVLMGLASLIAADTSALHIISAVVGAVLGSLLGGRSGRPQL